jgi:transposase
MTTLMTREWPPAIQSFFERLTAVGNPFKLAMTARGRKLLTILNILMKSKTTWKNLPAP